MSVLLILMCGIICYVIGRFIMQVMGIGMIGSLGRILCVPMLIGLLSIILFGGIIIFIIKCIIMIFSWFISVVAACIPGICVIGIIYLVVRAVKRR